MLLADKQTHGDDYITFTAGGGDTIGRISQETVINLHVGNDWQYCQYCTVRYFSVYRVSTFCKFIKTFSFVYYKYILHSFYKIALDHSVAKMIHFKSYFLNTAKKNRGYEKVWYKKHHNCSDKKIVVV